MQMKQSLLRSPSRRYRRRTPCYILKHKISFTHLEALESSHRRCCDSFCNSCSPSLSVLSMTQLKTKCHFAVAYIRTRQFEQREGLKSLSTKLWYICFFFRATTLNRFVLRQQTADLGIGWQPHAAQPIPPGYRGLPSAGASPQANGEHGGAEEASRGAVKYVPAAGAPLWDLSAKADFPWTVSTPAVRIHCTPGQTVSCRSTNRSRRPCRVEKKKWTFFHKILFC